MNAKELETDGDNPVFERRLFEILHTVKTWSNPVAGNEHSSRDRALGGIDIVHQRRRADDAPNKNG
jgi:hypothetical protein